MLLNLTHHLLHLTKEMYLYKCWMEYYQVDEQEHQQKISRTREGEPEHTPASDPVGPGKGATSGNPGESGDGKGKGKSKGKGKDKGKPAPKKVAKEKTQDQLARNVPRSSCAFLWVVSLFVSMTG